ncbi:MAG: cell division protein ZapA [Candidatus Fimenecus sp.]
MKNKVKIKIGGFTYNIKTDNTPEYTEEIARDIDAKFEALKNANPTITLNQMAVLICLDFAEDVKKSRDKANESKEKIKEYLEDANKARTERDFYKRELDRLKTEQKQNKNQVDMFVSKETDILNK